MRCSCLIMTRHGAIMYFDAERKEAGFILGSMRKSEEKSMDICFNNDFLIGFFQSLKISDEDKLHSYAHAFSPCDYFSDIDEGKNYDKLPFCDPESHHTLLI